MEWKKINRFFKTNEKNEQLKHLNDFDNPWTVSEHYSNDIVEKIIWQFLNIFFDITLFDFKLNFPFLNRRIRN